MADSAIRIAMWSGPRNISTAMLRSWENRPDTFVCDEPLYAHYLQQTGREHPGASEVIEHHETDWRKVVAWLTDDVPDGQAVFYQKHMAHHLLPMIERDWLSGLTNCFLIRDPREMITSLLQIIPDPKIEDTGMPQQVEIFELVRRRTGATPPVLDSRDVLEDPRRMLALLCEAVGVEFDESMLSWPAGSRDTDGIWAKHWYANVEKSTGFAPYRPKTDAVPHSHSDMHAECMEYYNTLYAHRLGQ